jgi:hypothetical protein
MNQKDGQTERQTVFFFHASFAGSVRREREREIDTREFSYGGDISFFIYINDYSDGLA